MYHFDTRVRFSEVDQTRRIRLEQIVNYLQDCSTFHSEDVKAGLDYLERKHRAWLLASWQIDILEYPKLGDEIQISTWPYQMKGIFAYRNFTIKNKKQEILVKANSNWFLIDTSNGKPVRIKDEDVRFYETGEKLSMEYLPRKIKNEENWEFAQTVSIRKSDFDTNGHINNSRYIEMALECIKDQQTICTIRTDYKKAATTQDDIYLYYYKNEEKNTITVKVCDENEETYVLIEFTLKRNKGEKND